jgi:hypothetical protein
MNIDIKRLKIEADYWDEVAPDWAESYGYASVLMIPVWFNGQRYRHVDPSQSSLDYEFGAAYGYSAAQVQTVATRPIKPAAPEYDGTGFPPVGTECEFRIGGGPTKWHPCTVRYILAGDEDPEADGWRAVVWCPHLEKDQLAHLPRFQFRPVRTQAERDREEFVTAALRVAPRPTNDEIHPRQYLIDSLNALYDTGKFMRRADK